jgi:dynein heavy chain
MLDSPDFDMANILQASQALGGIMKWVIAMVKYHELLKIVNPKRAKVAEMNEALAIVKARLAEKIELLRQVEEKMASLEKMYNEKLEEERKLKEDIEDCQKKLDRAAKIIDGLSSEKEKWSDTVERLTNESDLLIGDSLVAAGMVAYSGPFTAKYRAQLENEWENKIRELGVKCTKGVNMKDILEDKVLTMTWTAASLPSDNLSIENGIIMFKSRRWPLMIDPQNQANKFLKNLGKDQDACKNNMKYYKASDPSLMKHLELSIQNGDWFLVENVGEVLDPALEPVLQKQVDKSGTIRMGDKQIPYDKDFMFFLTTTLPNPHYSPET